MITVDQFTEPCGCRSVGECTHNFGAEPRALDALVDAFAAAMKAKLHRKYWREGYTGWDEPANEPAIRDSLARHVAKGDMIDVANLAAMLWNFGAIAPTSSSGCSSSSRDDRPPSTTSDP